MSNGKTSFLDILYEVVESQNDEELKRLIFVESKEALSKAYEEGWEAGKKKVPASVNPYPVSEEQVYSKNIAWSEGWMAAYLDSEMR